MKDSMKKVLCLTMAVLTCGSMVACTPDDDLRTNPNADKFLNIAYFNGGVTADWLRELELEYEAAHPDVEVLINDELKDELLNNNLRDNIEYMSEDIIFAHEITYSDFVRKNLLLDITDIVKAPAAAGEDTVEQRMNENLRSYYNANDKYYAVPFYTSFYGAIYNVDLFEEEALYIAKDGGYTSGLAGQPEKSYGKDGEKGTYDDGLPVTFEEYKTWLAYVKGGAIMPYIWTSNIAYRTLYLESLQIGYEGVNDYSINVTFNGTTKAGKTITPANAYEIRGGKGAEFALSMAKEIISNGYYTREGMTGLKDQFSMRTAQDLFLDESIAMIIEGGWWEKEAGGVGDRRFAYMPVPQYDDNAEAGETFCCTSGDVAVAINANTKQADLAKDFLKFTLTEHAMSTFTKNMGITRPYDYDLEDGVYDQLSYFGKNFWDLVNNPNSKIYYQTKSNEFKATETTFFGEYEWAWGSVLDIGKGSTTYTDPFKVFYDNNTISVADYIKGMNDKYNATNYTAKYNEWLASQN